MGVNRGVGVGVGVDVNVAVGVRVAVAVGTVGAGDGVWLGLGVTVIVAVGVAPGNRTAQPLRNNAERTQRQKEYRGDATDGIALIVQFLAQFFVAKKLNGGCDHVLR